MLLVENGQLPQSVKCQLFGDNAGGQIVSSLITSSLGFLESQQASDDRREELDLRGQISAEELEFKREELEERRKIEEQKLMLTAISSALAAENARKQRIQEAFRNLTDTSLRGTALSSGALGNIATFGQAPLLNR